MAATKRGEPREKDLSPVPDRPKEINQILDEQIATSLKEFNRSNLGLFISSFSAGLEIAFSVLLMASVITLFYDSLSHESMTLALALCYPVGFIFVIIGRSELFTEHTSLAILPVLNGSVSIKSLLALWGIVYAGNIIGGLVSAILITFIGTQIGFVNFESFAILSEKLTSHNWYVILFSAILAGWMMGLLGWLITSSQETLSRIFMVILVTAIIGLAGLHHCIVGSVELLTGLLSGHGPGFAEYINVQFWSTVGNIIGGTFFVAILKFSHVRVN
ncbi:MAG: formate/nitrite transporter family protein [Cytophagales bacterium]